MRAILLAGYKPTTGDNVPWLETEDQIPILEKRLQDLRQITHRSVVVLAGNSADRALSECRSLDRCELVFDTNGDSSTLLSNLRAALHTGTDPAIVLPVELPLGNPNSIKAMIHYTVQHGLNAPYDLLHGSNESFPLILTQLGCEKIARFKSITGLNDPNLTRHVTCL